MTNLKSTEMRKEENKNKIILDLCGGTGSWSKPYKDAGYDVRVITYPDFDVSGALFGDKDLVFLHKKGEMGHIIPWDKIYGVLAAPPCTMFSMARTVAKTPRDLRGAMEVVDSCLKIIWNCQFNGKRLKFWAMENPKARLRWFMGLPAKTFNPYDFGDAHRKPTDLWGNFNTKLRRKPVKLNLLQRKQSQLNLRELPTIPADYKIDQSMSKRAIARSITPAGFAKAFYEANK
jgi:hypothetical protein